MKQLRILIICLCLCFALFLLFTDTYIRFFAHQHITSILQKHIAKDITIDHITYAFPFGLSLRNIDIPAKGTIEELRVFITPQSLFSQNKKVSSVDVIQPQFRIHYHDLKKNLPLSSPKASSSNTSEQNTFVSIQQINILNGTIQSTQHTLQSVQGHIDDITFPFQDEQIDFTLRGQYLFNQMTAVLQMHGWMNWTAKDMHAKMTLVQKDLPAEMNADLEARSNDLNVSGKLTTSAHFQHPLIKDAILKTFLENENDIEDAQVQTHFSFQTQLDQPRLQKLKFYGDVITPEV